MSSYLFHSCFLWWWCLFTIFLFNSSRHHWRADFWHKEKTKLKDNSLFLLYGFPYISLVPEQSFSNYFFHSYTQFQTVISSYMWGTSHRYWSTTNKFIANGYQDEQKTALNLSSQFLNCYGPVHKIGHKNQDTSTKKLYFYRW